MSTRLVGSLRESPVEMVAGLITLVFGLALTTLEGWPELAGATLTAVSSYLISWTMAAVKAKADARAELQERMAQVGTHLATTSSQIVEAVRAGELGESGAETAFARVRDGATGLFGLVQQIEEQSGKAISSKAVIQNVEKLMELSSRLRVLLSTSDSVDAEELHEVQSAIEAVAEELSDRPVPRPTESAKCPQCGEQVEFPLGERKGDSAMPTCSNCRTRFHAHRQGDGGIFTRRHGSRRLVSLREIEVDCPKCSRSVSLKVAEDEEELKVRFCISCYTRLTIDPAESAVVRHHDATVHDTVEVGLKGSESVLKCTGCGRDTTSFLRTHEGTFAVCHRCDPPRLLRVKTSGNGNDGPDLEKVFLEVDRLKKLSREAAVSYLRKMVHSNPNRSELHQVLGASLRKWAVEQRDRGDNDRANKLLRESIVAHEKAIDLLGTDDSPEELASIHYAKGRALLESNQLQEARTSFEETLRIDEGHVKASDHLSKVVALLDED